MDSRAIYIGFDPDPREALAYAVARDSIRRNLSGPVPIKGLVLADLRRKGLYWRNHQRRDGQLWDVISQAPMATEFAISRFLVPHLAGSGLAAFLDADMLALGNMCRLFDEYDRRFAVMCVKHKHAPVATEKMDGKKQTAYPRKNWSSLMVFNCSHPSNRKLTVEMVNTLPGRDLHRFCWLDDDEIGELDPAWNFLVGHSAAEIEPKIVHFTSGGPWLPGFENVAYAEQWREHLTVWAR